MLGPAILIWGPIKAWALVRLNLSPPRHFHLLQDISKEIHISFGGVGGGNNRIRPAAVLTSVFTKSVWIKEKAVVLAQEQVCTKGRSSTAFLKFLDPVSCTHTDAQTLALQRYQALWLYVQSACILLGCILKSSAASLGGPVDRRINQRDVKTANIIIRTGKFRQRA